MSDTVTLAIEGIVSLPDFSTAVSRFNGLIAALAAESHAESVTWQIDALDYSSAITTARGIPHNGEQPEAIERVVRAYNEVGQALEEHTTIPYSSAVQQEAKGLTELLLRPEIKAIRFETAESESIIRTAEREQEPARPVMRKGAYGAVTGRIQTLTSRNALRFIVYDHIHDRAVSCYLVEGKEAMMRQMWDRVATVEGWITRDPDTGRPLTVRRVSRVTPLSEAEPQDYMKARGALPSDDEKPEDVIRRLRDAG